MLDGTYTGLQASVAAFLDRTDLTAVIPDFIAMAEAQITRRLMKDGPVREMMAQVPITISAEFTDVPADFAGARALYLAPNYRRMDFAQPENIVERKTLYPSASGDPLVFSVVGGQLQMWPWSAGTFSGQLTYWQRIPALATAVTNWLLSAHPDAYLYGACLKSAPYIKDDSRISVWGAAFEAILSDIVAADQTGSMAPHLAIGIVLGGTP